MIDLHNHVLPGVDDGPGTEVACVALARVAAEEGTRTLLATPHVDVRYGVDPRQIAPRVSAMRAALERAGVEIDLRSGGELSLRRLPFLDDEQLDAIRLGGGSTVLLECPFQAPVSDLEAAMLDLQRRGLRVLLAHPERCPALIGQLDAVRRLVEAGGMCSVTAGSLTGSFGRPVRSFVLDLLHEGLVHNIASDAHDHAERPPCLGGALVAGAALIDGFEVLGRWLVDDAPAAILAGAELPPRPPLPPRREPAQAPRPSGLARFIGRRRGA